MKTSEKTTTENKSLFNIKNDYLVLMSEIEEAEGELTPEQITALQINEKELNKKSIAYLEVIKQKEAFNLIVDNEIKRLQAIKKQNNNLVTILNERLLEAVKLFGEFTTGTLTFGTRKSQRVIITDEEIISKKYKVIKVTEIINKVEIKKDIKDGIIIPGAEIQDNLNLKIK